MSLLSIMDFAMEAFADSDIAQAWRDSQISIEKGRSQTLLTTEHTNTAAVTRHTNTAPVDVYARIPHTNVYTRAAGTNSYSRVDARNSYTRVSHTNTYSQVLARNSYSQTPHTDVAARNAYTRVGHTDVAARNSYDRVAHTDVAARNRYTEVGHTDVAGRNSYTQVAHTNVAARDRYSQTPAVNTPHTNSYSQASHTDVAARNRYTQVAHTDTAHTNTYTQTPYVQQSAADAYTKVYRVNSYTRVAATSYTRTYSYTKTTGSTYTRGSYLRYGVSDDEGFRQGREGHYEKYSKYTEYMRYTRTGYYTQYTRTAHTNVYTQTFTTNYYNRRAAIDRPERNTYTRSAYRRVAARNSYDRTAYSQTPARNSYTQRAYGRTAHTNSYTQSPYSQTAARDTYTERAYSRVAARDSYSRSAYSQTVARDVYLRTSYSRVNAQDSYNRAEYSRTPHTNVYSEQGHVNAYTRNAEQNLYDRVAGENTYTRVEARDTYNKIDQINTYTRQPAVSRDDVIEPAYSKKFDHKNYIPSAPAVYNLEGKTIDTGSLEIRLASYDKNKDVPDEHEFCTPDSTTIYYTVKIRQVQDENGNIVNGPWKTIATSSTSTDFNVDVAAYPDGIYELSTKANNSSISATQSDGSVFTRTAAEYSSAERITTFTINNSGYMADIVVTNPEEFYNYIFGNETFADRAENIKKYVDTIIYANAGANGHPIPQKGIFAEIDLTDTDIGDYHKVYAGLTDGSHVIHPTNCQVIFETDASGNPKPGSKKGVVYIPLGDITDDFYKNVFITLDVTEYRDPAMTVKRGTTHTEKGITTARNVIYVGLDGAAPEAIIAPSGTAKSRKVEQDVSMSVTETGFGLSEVVYQIVESGKTPTDGGWQNMDGGGSTRSKNITITTPGTWDVYIKATDRAGNETVTVEKGFEVAYENVTYDTPTVVKKDEDFDVKATIITDLDIDEVNFYTDEDPTTPIPGHKVSETDLGDGKKKYVYEAELPGIPLPDGRPVEDHTTKVVVDYTNGDSTTKTKPIKVVQDYGTIIGQDVVHTSEWKSNLDKFNSEVSPSEVRSDHTFWAGEIFVVTSATQFEDIDCVNPGALCYKVDIQGANGLDPHGNRYSYSFQDYINHEDYLDDVIVDGSGKAIIRQKGNLWDSSMKDRWTGVTPLVFRFYYTDGTYRDVNVIVDNTTDYYLYHRQH